MLNEARKMNKTCSFVLSFVLSGSVGSGSWAERGGGGGRRTCPERASTGRWRTREPESSCSLAAPQTSLRRRVERQGRPSPGRGGVRKDGQRLEPSAKEEPAPAVSDPVAWSWEKSVGSGPRPLPHFRPQQPSSPGRCALLGCPGPCTLQPAL